MPPPLPPAATIVPQLRLLAVSEVAVRMRGGEPAFVGEPAQAVLECAGPWRVASGEFERDEYDVLLSDDVIFTKGAYDAFVGEDAAVEEKPAKKAAAKKAAPKAEAEEPTAAVEEESAE